MVPSNCDMFNFISANSLSVMAPHQNHRSLILTWISKTILIYQILRIHWKILIWVTVKLSTVLTLKKVPPLLMFRISDGNGNFQPSNWLVAYRQKMKLFIQYVYGQDFSMNKSPISIIFLLKTGALCWEADVKIEKSFPFKTPPPELGSGACD